jgi:hypothetical protein
MEKIAYGSDRYLDILNRAKKVLWFTTHEPLAQALLAAEEQLKIVNDECMEQARLNGMGSEREAKLLAKIEELNVVISSMIDYEEVRF